VSYIYLCRTFNITQNGLKCKRKVTCTTILGNISPKVNSKYLTYDKFVT